MKPAQWSHGTGSSKKINPDGTAVAALPLMDAGKLAGTLNVTLTADRHLRVQWDGQPDAAPLTFFEAWST